jgi:photosystem II stability/assembly factor-like uncharacterized protein
MSRRVSTTVLALLAALAGRASADSITSASSGGLPGVSHRSRLYDAAAHESNAYVVGFPGLLLRTSDQGKSFTPVSVPTQDALFSIDINKAGLGAVVGRSGLVLLTSDGGATWTKTNAFPKVEEGEERPHLFAVDVLESGIIVAVGNFATIVRSADRGKTWQRITFDPTRPKPPEGAPEAAEREDENEGFEDEARLTGIAFGDENSGFVVGEFGMVLKSEDAGATWSRQRGATGKLLFAVHAASGSHAAAAGSDGSVLETRDGGATWQLLSTPTTNHLFGVWLTENSCTAVGADGTVLVRRGGEAAFELVATHVHTWLSSVSLHDAAPGLVTGGLGHLLVTRDAGRSFSTLTGE